MKNNLVVISLGSNQNNRKDFLVKAVDKLTEKNKLICLSSLYEASPTDFLEQDHFLNAIAIFLTKDSPEDFFKNCRQIEKNLGQPEVKKIEKGPRKIDLDIILYNQECIDKKIGNNHLTLPHKSYHERLFVLKPMLECEKILDHTFKHPLLKKSTEKLLENGERKKLFADQKIKVFQQKWHPFLMTP